MELYKSLFEISKLLLSQTEPSGIAEHLLQRVLVSTEAERGFVVMREGSSYEEKFSVRYDRQWSSPAERKFSRSLVREVIERQELIHSPNLTEDPRFLGQESVLMLGDCAVLVVPLRHAGEVWGVIYLERRGKAAAFSEEACQYATEFAGVAGFFLKNSIEKASLTQRNQTLERELFSKYNFTGIVTQHPKMIHLLKMVAQIADSEATVLIRGESGSGKELIAQALHSNSRRQPKPFVALHCAALPASILESELFGHTRGAFTGAERERKGRISAAEGGTLFLDEIAEIPMEVQAKLLRFLQSGEIQRVGSDKVEFIHTRIVAATHQNLAQLASSGKFRQDLYFRLKVIELELPPLRERSSDIMLLLQHFLKKYWKRSDSRPQWTEVAEQALLAHPYPGNIRELEHIVQRACLLAHDSELGVELLPSEVEIKKPKSLPLFSSLDLSGLQDARDRAVSEVERNFIAALLKRSKGNVSEAARQAGMLRRHLQKLLARHRPDLGLANATPPIESSPPSF